MVCRRGLRERENVNQTSHISIREVLKHLQNQQEREREKVGDGTHTVYTSFRIGQFALESTHNLTVRERDRPMRVSESVLTSHRRPQSPLLEMSCSGTHSLTQTTIDKMNDLATPTSGPCRDRRLGSSY